MKQTTQSITFLAFLCLAIFWSITTNAQEKKAVVDILPAKSVDLDDMGIDPNGETHPPIRVTPDKSEIVKLEKEAYTILVGNPLHLSVLADSPKTLILVGREPGASHFTALDQRGNVIMARHVIVASPKEHYIRVRSACANGGDECQETQVYYCPDMCHRVLIDSASESSNAPALPTGPEDPGSAPSGETGPVGETP